MNKITMVVAFLGVNILGTLIAISILTALDKTSPDVLEMNLIGSLTGLTGILVRTENSKNVGALDESEDQGRLF